MATRLSAPSAGSHTLHLSPNRVSSRTTIAQFLREGLRRREHVVSIATSETQAEIDADVRAGTATVDATSRYTALEADELIATLLVDAKLDREHFVAMMQDEFGSALHAGRPIYVYDELGVRLWVAGLCDAALAVEECWQIMTAQYSLAILCAYPMTLFQGSQSEPFLNLCARHSQVSLLSESGPMRTTCPV